MSMTDPYAKYLETQVMTATPGKLLIMTFDAAIRFSHAAKESMKANKLDEQSTNIRKVQNILLELMASLNHQVDAKLTADLDALYTYMFDRLTAANIHDDFNAIDEVMGILSSLRSTWVEAETTARTGGSPTEQETVAA